MGKEKTCCPRCGSSKCRKNLLNRPQVEIRCLNCGLTIRGTDPEWVLQKWKSTKEDDVAYAIPLLQSSDHNAYLGKLDLLIWRDADLTGYLCEQTGLEVSLREPDVVEEGMVAEAR